MKTKNEEVLACLDEWERVAFDNQEDLMKLCCKSAIELIEISFSYECVRIIVLVHSGAHVCDSICIGDWINFFEEHYVGD